MTSSRRLAIITTLAPLAYPGFASCAAKASSAAAVAACLGARAAVLPSLVRHPAVATVASGHGEQGTPPHTRPPRGSAGRHRLKEWPTTVPAAQKPRRTRQSGAP